jgi:hypothetical protein
LPVDLVDPTSGSPLRRTWSRCQPRVEASAHYKDNPSAPKLRRSDRTTDSSSPQSTAGACVIFDPAALITTGWSKPVPGRVYPRCGPPPFHGASLTTSAMSRAFSLPCHSLGAHFFLRARIASVYVACIHLCHPNLLSPFPVINSVLPTNHLFDHDQPR